MLQPHESEKAKAGRILHVKKRRSSRHSPKCPRCNFPFFFRPNRVCRLHCTPKCNSPFSVCVGAKAQQTIPCRQCQQHRVRAREQPCIDLTCGQCVQAAALIFIAWRQLQLSLHHGGLLWCQMELWLRRLSVSLSVMTERQVLYYFYILCRYNVVVPGCFALRRGSLLWDASFVGHPILPSVANSIHHGRGENE